MYGARIGGLCFPTRLIRLLKMFLRRYFCCETERGQLAREIAILLLLRGQKDFLRPLALNRIQTLFDYDM